MAPTHDNMVSPILLQYANKMCCKYGVSLIIRPKRTIDRTLGYFEHYKRKIVVAGLSPSVDWTLAHELGHLHYFIHKESKFFCGDADSRMEKWLSGGKKRPNIRTLRTLQRNELCADVYALSLLRKLGISDPYYEECEIRNSILIFWAMELEWRFGANLTRGFSRKNDDCMFAPITRLEIVPVPGIVEQIAFEDGLFNPPYYSVIFNEETGRFQKVVRK